MVNKVKIAGIWLGVMVIGLAGRAARVEAVEWNQDAGNAQRTGYTAEEPEEPWVYKWSWNGPDSNGGGNNYLYYAPQEARIITGEGKVFAAAGVNGIYALDIVSGKKLWNFTAATINASPAYDPQTGSLWAGGTNGVVYKIRAGDGTISKTYSTNDSFNKAVLISGNNVYLTSGQGVLYKFGGDNLNLIWSYPGNSAAATPPTYSNKGLLVFATEDLYVHAVDDSSGSRRWRVKPSTNPAGFPFTFSRGWPVVAEKHGIVLLRMQLTHDAMAGGGVFPTTNEAIRSYLQNNLQYKNLFALNLDTGNEAFIPAVGYGSIEDFINGQPYGVMGSQPVIKTYNDGVEVAYIPWRNGQTTPTVDYRWGGHMGEMVLDGATIPGMQAGDLRFVKMSGYSGYGGDSYIYIIDEECPLTMAGNSIFHAHWGASESVKITDRSANKGLSYSNPINTTNHPVVIRTMSACGSMNTATHWTDCGLNMYDDGRYWGGPGWWVYWNMVDPSGKPQSRGFRPLYTVVSNGYVLVEGNGGEIFALKHSGITISPTSTPPVSPTVIVKEGDATGDGLVNGQDYAVWLTFYGGTTTKGPKEGDFNNDAWVNGKDYMIWLVNYDSNTR